jgi:signal transduction histidine kinase
MTDPMQAGRRSASALAHVEALSADGSPIPTHGGVNIPPRRQRITLSFTGLSLSVPERIMFRYRLDGFDRDWSEPVSARQAVYTNLGPGMYRFRVIASNSDGAWNGSEAALRFSIEPAFWQTMGFRASIILLMGLVCLTGYRKRVTNVARQLNVRFEERLAERTRIAQELHDTLLQGFVSASMQLHVVADRVPADSPAKPALGRALDLMRRVIEDGRNSVRGLRSSTSVSNDLQRAFSGIAEELGFDGQVDYRVIVEGRPRPLNPIVSDDVYRIGREALVNAFRHSDARRIEVELVYAPSELKMFVRDNGRGIGAEILRKGNEGHWGLAGMRERAHRIGARFKVWSGTAAGTEVELSIPAHLAFKQEKSTSRREWTRRFRQYATRCATAPSARSEPATHIEEVRRLVLQGPPGGGRQSVVAWLSPDVKRRFCH